MTQMISIIDYGMGNIQSVARKCERLGFKTRIISSPADVLISEKIILPGVGHFKKAIENLKSHDLWDALNEAVMKKKIPILGICLGMQLMAKKSEEGNVPGFGWFDAEVIKFRINDVLKYKVPHIGWNRVTIEKESILFNGVDLTTGFYFVHAYHFKCNNPSDILNRSVYEIPFVSAVQKENMYGVQYHPEKSHDSGEQLLKNFLRL